MPIHPFVLALYPILFYWNLNKHEVLFSETMLPAIVSLIFALGLFALFLSIFKKANKASVLTSIVLILFFFDEAIRIGMTGSKVGNLILSYDPNLFFSYGIFIVLTVVGLLTLDSRWKGATVFLNVVAFVLIMFPILELLNHHVETKGIHLFSETKPDTATYKKIKYDGPKPDIYYIILDGYLREDVMKEYWGFDNSSFTNFLTRNEFFVASKSRSNYPSTGLSLASSLNMKYIPTDLKVDTPRQINNLPFITAVGNNEVVSFLKSIGYKYVHLSDDAADSKINDQADIVITNRKNLSLFSQYLLAKTFLNNFDFDFIDSVKAKRSNTLYGFKEFEEIPKNPESTFTFAHFLMPHGPQSFDRDGGIPLQSDKISEKYFGEVQYANRKIKNLVSHILKTSQEPPIIIIQGDHGYLVKLTNRPDAKQVKKAYSNLNAYYLPGDGRDQLYETITPVNSFRLIFDHYFGTNLGLLEDKSYFPVNYTKMRKLVSVPYEDSLDNSPSAWVSSLEEDVLKNPDFPEAHAMLGVYYALLERFEEAGASVSKAISLNPDLIWAHINLAMIHLSAGHITEALDAINKANLINSEMPEVHSTRGEIHMTSGNFLEAITDFEKALKINPNDAKVVNNIAKSYSFLDDKEKSISHFEKAVMIAPTFTNYYDLSTAYAKFGLFEKAALNMKAAVEINPNISKAYYKLGNIYMKNMNSPNKAVTFYKKALTLDSEYILAHLGLGNAFMKLNQPNNALLEFKKAVKLNPRHILSYVNLGYLQLRLGQIEQAKATYETALLKKQANLTSQPEYAEIHKNLGIIYDYIKEDTKKVAYHFQESLRIAPNQPNAPKIKEAIKDILSQN